MGAHNFSVFPKFCKLKVNSAIFNRGSVEPKCFAAGQQKRQKNNVACKFCEITSDHAIEIISTKYLVRN